MTKRNACCFDRYGFAKRMFPNLDAALEAVKATRKGGRDTLEPYKCRTHPGAYHVRNKRRYAMMHPPREKGKHS